LVFLDHRAAVILPSFECTVMVGNLFYTKIYEINTFCDIKKDQAAFYYNNLNHSNIIFQHPVALVLIYVYIRIEGQCSNFSKDKYLIMANEPKHVGMYA
jgi:hypothetical protein